MSSSDRAIAIRGLGKAYTIRHNHTEHITLAELTLDRVRHPFRRPDREEIWALNDITFDLRQGDVLGLIGRNGAGKSTLLKILSRVTSPTTGEVRLWGRVGSLLEVGTGFHPELTGRENIYLNGSILGMRRVEIDRQFDAIVEFAGVSNFLDTPVKRYSSGMYVRLAFAVAAHLRSEILLIDEVLAVGDAAFQQLCLARIRELRDDGRTVILVSHQAETIRANATVALLLAEGKVIGVGDVAHTLQTYESMGSPIAVHSASHARRSSPFWGRQARICSISAEREEPIASGDYLTYDVTIEVSEPLPALHLTQTLYDSDGRPVGTSFSTRCTEREQVGRVCVRVRWSTQALAPGHYSTGLILGAGGPFEPLQDFDVVVPAVEFDVTMQNDHGAIGKWHSFWGSAMLAPLSIELHQIDTNLTSIRPGPQSSYNARNGGAA